MTNQSSYYFCLSENEKNWLNVIEKLNKENNFTMKPLTITDSSDHGGFQFNKHNQYALVNNIELKKYFNEIEQKLIMKQVLLSSPSLSLLKNKEDFVSKLEYLMRFMKEQLDKKMKLGDADYYQYMDFLDDLKGYLAFAHDLPDDKALFHEQGKYYDTKKLYDLYSIKDDQKPDPNLLKDDKKEISEF